MSAPEVRDYVLCGCRLASAIDLPELPVWTGPADVAPEIEIRLGAVPDRLTDPIISGPFLEIDAAGTGRVMVAGVASFLIQAGRLIVIEPLMPETAPDIRQFLFGTAFGLLCHQRSWLPLHAGAVAVGGRALILAGASGAGKSTLVAALARRGHGVLADDVSVIEWRDASEPLLLPAVAWPKLWRDTITALGLPLEEAARVRAGLEKYRPSGFAPPAAPSLPLGAVIHLVAIQDAGDERVERLRGMEAMAKLRENVYRGHISHCLGRDGTVFAATARVSASVASFVVRHRHDFANLSRLTTEIEELAEAGQ